MNHHFLVTIILALTAQGVVAGDFATEMMEATFKLDTGSQDVSTCFLVRREAPDTAFYLVAAAHTFQDSDSETAKLALRERKPDGSYERHDYDVPIRHGTVPLWVANDKVDVAVLRIAEPLPVKVDALPATAVADEARLKASGVHLCSALFHMGYPWRLEGDASGIPVARRGTFASPPLLPLATHPTYLGERTAFPGDSGGPVFIEDAGHHPLIVGIVSNNHYYVDETAKTALGVVDIVHAQLVRDTIEAAAKQGEAVSKGKAAELRAP